LVYDTKRKKKLPLDLRFCDEVLIELRKTKHYDINAAFMQPVDPVALNIPHYHKIIKKPMDLQTMSNKLASGDYSSAKEFDKDFELIIKNCKTFNGEDHVVYAQALRLQDLYRAEMSKKDEWMAKHAPVAAATTQVAARDESESEDAESEADAEHDEERKQVENRLSTIQKRLEQEQKKVNEMVNSGTAEMADVEIAQSVVALLQKQMMTERGKLASMPAKKPGKPKPTKSKKAGSAPVAAKKAAVAGSGGGAAAKRSGGTKKAAPKKKIGPVEKEVIIESLSNLDGPLLERAIDLIKKDTGQGENDAGELELDIETVSEEALVKLYEIAIKANPSARVDKERQQAPAAPESTAKPKQASSKSKKNKPMSKSEQERRIQQLNELRAQAGRQGSNSQEPMESIEGNGTEAAHHPDHESEDEVDSEED
jgi:bromodomain-containing factor 1